jgi:hypothetical protein
LRGCLWDSDDEAVIHTDSDKHQNQRSENA